MPYSQEMRLSPDLAVPSKNFAEFELDPNPYSRPVALLTPALAVD